MIFLAALCAALLAFAFWQAQSFAAERRVWANERRELNNRIQAPEAAPFLDTAGPAELQHVHFDDDEAYHAAQEENA